MREDRYDHDGDTLDSRTREEMDIEAQLVDVGPMRRPSGVRDMHSGSGSERSNFQ